MIVLDTNIVSEVMRPRPEPRVMAWLQAQAIQELATTTITLAEIGLGLARLPESRRRFNLETKFQAFISRGLGPRVFGFDAAAAAVYGEMAAVRERGGRQRGARIRGMGARPPYPVRVRRCGRSAGFPVPACG